jgi:hypothetical protein
MTLSDEIRRLTREGMTKADLIAAGFRESTIRYALGRLLGGAGRFSSGLVVDTITEPEPFPEVMYQQEIASGHVTIDRREDALKYKGGAY